MRRLVFVLFVLASSVLLSCSEKDRALLRDVTAPEVRILYPYDATPKVFVVSDSLDTYLVARDIDVNGQSVRPEKVELWFAPPEDTVRVRVGDVGQPITIDQVPEDIRPRIIVPAGWSLYTRRWYTGPTPLPPIGSPIISGTFVQLYAFAYDAAGNVGRSTDLIRISVFNKGDDLKPPIPDFTITPPTGNTATTFTFDASITTDRINPVHQIRVRWDFDGNPGNGWDIDWNRDARADDIQHWQFKLATSYSVLLEAHNTYLPATIVQAHRGVIVSPIGGDPRPPEPWNYAEIPSGTYIRGDSLYVLDGRTYRSDAREQPQQQITLSSRYLIEKTEVTNRLYLAYLQKTMHEDDPPNARYSDGVIYARDLVLPDVWYVAMIVSRSRIYFNLDSQTFAVQAGFEEHPVTGVTWQGASYYALEYGLRLPSEAEWEVAARGADGQLSYPFAGGIELTQAEGPRRVNYAGSRSAGDPFANTTTPIRFYNGQTYEGFQTIDTPSIFGLYDMAGNVAEWVQDWLDPSLPGYNQLDVTNPQGAIFGTYRIVRGGSFQTSRAGVRCTARAALPPEESYITVGFRTAYFPTDSSTTGQ